MSKKEGNSEARQAYKRQSLGGGGKCEPNNSLMKKRRILKRLKNQASENRPHLFPEEVGQTNRATTSTTQDEQAKKHDQKQDDVGNYRRDEIKYGGLGLDWRTERLSRDPNRANLRMA